MWLFTPFGFFSVVATRDDTSMLMVRARDKRHLEALIFGYLMELSEDTTGDGWPILDQPDSDYRHRVVVSKELWGKVLLQLNDELVYNNFKSEASKRGADRGYLDGLHHVWEALWRHLGDRTPPYAHTRAAARRWWDAEPPAGRFNDVPDADDLWDAMVKAPSKGKGNKAKSD